MKKIWKYLLLIISVMLKMNTVIGQINLVPNGSFEQQYSCPTTTSQVDSCIAWHRVRNTPFGSCSPDYFDTCAPYPVSIPDNLCGYQFPFEGHAYIGIYTFHWSYFYREIIGAQLTDTLKPNNNYHISMRISRGNWTPQAQNQTASNKIGIRFTSYVYANTDTPAINNYAQVYSDSIIEDTLNWVLLAWDYVPDSAYSHFYIGNFFDDAHTDTNNIGWNFGQAYYFIDSINIVCISPSCLTSINEMPNDKQDIVYDIEHVAIFINGFGLKQCKFTLYNEAGQIVMSRRITNNETINISEFSAGFYTAVLRSAKKNAYKKIIKF